MYTDRPQPTKGYILFWVFFIIGIFLMFQIPTLASYFIGRTEGAIIALAIGMALPSLLFTLLAFAAINAAYHTQYVIKENTIEIKAGSLVSAKVYRRQIKAVEKTHFNSRVLGWGTGNIGACNRFYNGVVIHATKDFYISPSDPDAFIASLKTSEA